MKITSYYSHLSDEISIVKEFSEKLIRQSPSFIICYYTEEYSISRLVNAFAEFFPGVVVQGCSSCGGVMTDQGYHAGPVVTALVIEDNSVLASYGSAISLFPKTEQIFASEIKALTAETLDQAIKNADRIGELPSLVILHSTPGHEELIVEQLEEQLGGHVKLIGGSAADNKMTHKWSIFSGKQYTSSGISLSVLYSSDPLLTAFNCGYFPTRYKGKVTEANGRNLLKIDGKNAADVYYHWVKQYIQQSDDFNESSVLFPLGRIAGEVFNTYYYKLSHPRTINTESGSITLFTHFQEGEYVHLMCGGKKQLINRAAQVTQSAIDSMSANNLLHGGINIFCAGSMKVILDDIDDIYHQINNVYGQRAFICPFTFGEQGCFVSGENAHGNLMLSSVIFYSDKTRL